MKWAGHTACMGKLRNAYKVLLGKPDHAKDLGADG